MANMYYTQEDSEDEDDELLLIYMQFEECRRPRVLLDRGNPMYEFDDIDFRYRYRLSKEAVVTLLNRVRGQLEHPTNRYGQVSPLNQLLLTLRFYASGSFLITVGDISGVSASTVCRVLHKVSRVIANLQSVEVTFPASRAERASTMRDFYAIAQFPAVLGAINCTHVSIQSPGGEGGELYRNRKGYCSINVQTVSSASLLFQNVVARWPGSVHDSTIWSNSRLYSRFESGEIQDGYLLGDGGYACRPYLLTPLLAPASRPEERYNYAHIRTRNPVERSYGVLKRRWPALRYGLRVKVERACTIIVACVVLHNICIRCGDMDPPEDDQSLIAGRRAFEEVPAIEAVHDAGATTARTAVIGSFGGL